MLAVLQSHFIAASIYRSLRACAVPRRASSRRGEAPLDYEVWHTVQVFIKYQGRSYRQSCDVPVITDFGWKSLPFVVTATWITARPLKAGHASLSSPFKENRQFSTEHQRASVVSHARGKLGYVWYVYFTNTSIYTRPGRQREAVRGNVEGKGWHDMMCVFFTLNNSSYPSTSSTLIVRADSSS